jgi:hypothetical protein
VEFGPLVSGNDYRNSENVDPFWCRINPLKPNDPFSGRTAPLTSKDAFYIFIQQIYVLNILNMVYTLSFSS